MYNFDKVFKPKSVAIVGASNKEGSVGNILVGNLKKDFKGKIYPINLKETKVLGIKCYSSLSLAPQKIDLMIIAVPSKIVPYILEEGGKLGIKGSVIISAGFKEVGNLELENELISICNKYQITLIGPNCLGVLNPHISLNASFATNNASAGSVALISQSGAICTAILDSAEKMGLGFSKFVSVGNKAVIDEVELFNYLASDKETKVVAVYAEQLKNPEKIILMTKKLRKAGKPVIMLKAGRSQAGAKASASHTGALAGNDAIYDALFKQAGIIRASSIEDFFAYLKMFSINNLKKVSRLAVITNAGGPGVMSVDAISDINLETASLNKRTINKLKGKLPEAASLANPIDILGDAGADRYEIAIKEVLADSGVDSLLIILTPQAITDIELTAKIIIKAQKNSKKVVAVVFMGEEMVSSANEEFTKNSVVSYSFPEQAIGSLAALNTFNNIYHQKQEKESEKKYSVKKKVVEDIFAKAKAKGQKAFPENQALEILKAYGLPVLDGFLARDRKEAENFAKKFKKNLVLKIASEDILHKSDVGGICLNVSPENVGLEFEKMMTKIKKNKPKAKIAGIYLVEMIQAKGLEMILGSFNDPALGPAIMIGLGGIFVELFKDVAFAINPVKRSDVRRMIASLKADKLIAGLRGAKEKDREALIEVVMKLSKLLLDFPEITELDINPVLVLDKGKGVKVLDARIIIS